MLQTRQRRALRTPSTRGGWYDAPKQLIRIPALRAQSRSDHLRREGLGVGLPTQLADGLLEIALRRGDLAAQEARDAARGEDVRGREGRVRELLGVEGVRVCVGVLAGREPNGGLDALQEEVVLGPALGALELFAGEVRPGDRKVYLNGVGDARYDGEGC